MCVCVVKGSVWTDEVSPPVKLTEESQVMLEG